MQFSSDGSFLVAGIGQEHRLGRWWRIKEAKNSIVIIKLKKTADKRWYWWFDIEWERTENYFELSLFTTDVTYYQGLVKPPVTNPYGTRTASEKQPFCLFSYRAIHTNMGKTTAFHSPYGPRVICDRGLTVIVYCKQHNSFEHRLGRWWHIKEAKNSIVIIKLKRTTDKRWYR